MKISVVTTVYERPEHFRLFLASMEAQARRPDEIVAADDGSGEAVAKEIRRLARACALPVKIVRQEHEGYRVAAARNLALRAVKGDYAIFLDCDMAAMPDLVAVHEGAAAPGKVLSGSRALLGEEASESLFAVRPHPDRQAWEMAWRRADKSEMEAADAEWKKQARLRRWHLAKGHKPKVKGCHFSLPMDMVRAVNGFDERYVGWGYEDDDFARRLYKAGCKPGSVIATARAMHLWHPTLAPAAGGRHRDRPNRAYFRRWFVAARCKEGLERDD